MQQVTESAEGGSYSTWEKAVDFVLTVQQSMQSEFHTDAVPSAGVTYNKFIMLHGDWKISSQGYCSSVSPI